VKSEGAAGYEGIVQIEHALGRLEHEDGDHGAAAERGPYGPGSFAQPFLPGEESSDGGGQA
jgi:hypothetical protein